MFWNKGRIKPCKNFMGIRCMYFIDFGTMTVAFDSTNTNVIDDLGAVTALKYEVKSASNLEQTMTSGEETERKR